MKIYRDEIFGPVLSLVRAEHFSEAVDLINANPSRTARRSSPTTAERPGKFQREIEVGMVGHQRADPGAAGLLLLRWLEELTLRCALDLRSRRRALLHAPQGGDDALARSRASRRRPGLPAQPLGTKDGEE